MAERGRAALRSAGLRAESGWRELAVNTRAQSGRGSPVCRGRLGPLAGRACPWRNGDIQVVRQAQTSSGAYTGCPWDWFRTAVGGNGKFCPDGSNGYNKGFGCLNNYYWAYASAPGLNTGIGTVCVSYGGVNFEAYLDETQLYGRWYVPTDGWRQVYINGFIDCSCHWWCACLCCTSLTRAIKFNIPTTPNGPYGVFNFGWGFN